ncbi:hypothetical protein [Gordonia hydrophobica]|uniref:DUF3592 domain-containing protein n=1 Tax=Gordonia hydrophobica TaxID=40516 RepID=A0ABZ2U087_9ACTN|nr:hypothetical protein [Gordonia hydrophobica]MBM7367787.1 hypothetical protein [Gordonia hydrophobica]
MTLINPESRWWNRDSARRAAGYVLCIISILFALVGAWTIVMQDASPLPLWVSLVGNILPIPLLLAGTFLISFGTEEGFDSRLTTWSIAMYFIAIGSGALVGDAMASSPLGVEDVTTRVVTIATFYAFIGGGVVTIIVFEGVRIRSQRQAALRATVKRDGVVVSGVVTRARHYSVNYSPVTRVTVQFTDAEGQTRWTSTSINRTVNKGQSVKVTFSQQHLGRRGAVILS